MTQKAVTLRLNKRREKGGRDSLNSMQNLSELTMFPGLAAQLLSLCKWGYKPGDKAKVEIAHVK